jgi:hypothetical protein
MLGRGKRRSNTDTRPERFDVEPLKRLLELAIQDPEWRRIAGPEDWSSGRKKPPAARCSG